MLHGLCAAHRVNVVHRDVKPANILVADDNSIFLVDFGIAKITGDVSLTGKHTVLGTLEFLAPERLRGDATGPAADLWSLGVTLFYALEGYSPFVREGETAHAAMWAILRGKPPAPTRKGPLASVILRLLDSNPGSRANADELASVLESIVARRPPRPDRSRHRDRRSRWFRRPTTGQRRARRRPPAGSCPGRPRHGPGTAPGRGPRDGHERQHRHGGGDAARYAR